MVASQQRWTAPRLVIGVEAALLAAVTAAGFATAPIETVAGVAVGGGVLSALDEIGVSAHVLRLIPGRHPGDEDRTIGDALHAAWILVVIAACAAVVVLGRQGELDDTGLAFVAAAAPFAAAVLAVPSIVRRWRLDGGGSTPRSRRTADS